jgi:hypothetical protein
MRTSFVGFVCLLVFALLLTGCVNMRMSQSLTEAVYLVGEEEGVATIAPSVSEDVTEAETTPIVIESDDLQEMMQALKCGEVFCQMAWQGWLTRPFTYPDRDRIDLTYPYASTGDGSLSIHHGVEFPNPHGTLVRAAAKGEVIFAGSDELQNSGPYKNFYGNVVIIRHPALFNGVDLYSLYGHLSTIEVEEGAQIESGEVLGRVGASGVADGSHLHFEVRYGDNDYDHTTNPILWFSPLAAQNQTKTSVFAGLIADRFGKPLSEISITLQRIDDEGGVEKNYYFKTYAQDGINAHPGLNENFVLPDISPGDYRLTFYSGRLYEIFLTLEPGNLGFLRYQIH